ncbi:TROVE domain-containing protein [Oscillatoria sp. FACHB-1406]|uniref:TROVE domain-containing protein n=1 Tax=Oscillatoria sp. FACHB-1406 TaxID=2692846 RepID=UPI0016828C8B|nr:TROVE domain-containing protein [Oscillatoria sp. FACHB-1406]MBD2577433.1 TROVE domain-containing protein [Oscillatoria sp. FACHB-1406]
MSKLNRKAKKKVPALAGGFGMRAAVQSPEATLRRLVMANLLWEDLAYADGKNVSEAIVEVLPQVSPSIVAEIVREARFQQKLRHTPLYLIRLMAKLEDHKAYVADLLYDVCTRADMVTDFVALYWKEGKQPLSAQVKKGLAKALTRFDEYQLAKYDRATGVKLRDVLFLVHSKPQIGKEELYRKLAQRELATPDTWEVALSTGQDKKQSWERLLEEGKLGALAFLRNLRNMEQAEVSERAIQEAFKTIKSEYLLPINFWAAAKASPRWMREIESMMFRCFAHLEKLPGTTIFVVDVSGSMGATISRKSEFSRMDVAAAMAMLAAEQCETMRVYATAGSDAKRIHDTKLLPAYRGFALSQAIVDSKNNLGGGGIFTRQCLEYIRQQERKTPDRIIVFSDSQDCDLNKSKLPEPFGKTNYIIDVSAHQHGINYQGVWTAEVAGWSEHFLKFVAAMEQLSRQRSCDRV